MVQCPGTPSDAAVPDRLRGVVGPRRAVLPAGAATVGVLARVLLPEPGELPPDVRPRADPPRPIAHRAIGDPLRAPLGVLRQHRGDHAHRAEGRAGPPAGVRRPHRRPRLRVPGRPLRLPLQRVPRHRARGALRDDGARGGVRRAPAGPARHREHEPAAGRLGVPVPGGQDRRVPAALRPDPLAVPRACPRRGALRALARRHRAVRPRLPGSHPLGAALGQPRAGRRAHDDRGGDDRLPPGPRRAPADRLRRAADHRAVRRAEEAGEPSAPARAPGGARRCAGARVGPRRGGLAACRCRGRSRPRHGSRD